MAKSDVQGALIRAKTPLAAWADWSIDVTRDSLAATFRQVCEDRVALAAEVERLRIGLANLRSVVALMDVDGERQQIRDARVDAVVRELCETHGYGAVMDSAARQWRAKDPVGALMVGPCVATVQAVMRDDTTRED